MRFLVVVVTTGATLAFIAASCVMNWVFMTSLGKSEFEQQIFGVGERGGFRLHRPSSNSHSLGLSRAALLVRRSRRAGVSRLCRVFVVLGGRLCRQKSRQHDGRPEPDRCSPLRSEARNRGRGGQTQGARRASAAAVVQEALHGLEQDRKWQRSKGCQEATTEAMRAFCKGYFDLKAEAARAGELACIEGKIARLKSEARGYEEKGAGREADNQAAGAG